MKLVRNVPAYIRVFNVLHSAPEEFRDLAEYFQRDNSNCLMEKTQLDGHELFSAQTNAVRFSWLVSGQAAANDLTINPGDVLVLDQSNAIRVSGKGTFIDIHVTKTQKSDFAGVHRLADLQDTTGGCNIKTDGSLFRRLQLTWQKVAARDSDRDGANVIGCHTVMMNDDASSRAHYHPSTARGGGKAQKEMYFVLDAAQVLSPAHYEQLWDPAGRHGIETWEDPESQGEVLKVENSKTGKRELRLRLTKHGHFTPLFPGDVVCVDANIGHRGVGTIANVVAVPGFKPHNEIYLENATLV